MISPPTEVGARPVLGSETGKTSLRGDDLGRRDRKKNATRRALRYAALELAAERGFAHVTIEDITEAADVATRTFFNYFPSKESAVIGANPEKIEQIRVNLLERPLEETPLQALHAVAVSYAAAIDEEFDDLGDGREAWLRRLRIVRSDPDLAGAFAVHFTELERTLGDALAERLGVDPRTDPYPALVAATVFAAARIAGLHWSANGGTGSLAQLTSMAIDAVGNGLSEKTIFSSSVKRAR